MLTGNTPPALIHTHAYYEQHRWRRLIDPEQLRRYRDMHDGAGPITAQRWKEKQWADTLPAAQTANPGSTAPTGSDVERRHRGSLGRALAAEYPPVPCNRRARHKWGPGGLAIPDQLRNAPGQWTTIHLPPEIAEHLGTDRVHLSEPTARRRSLPHLLETGPADLIAAALTLPQLRSEWPHLELSDMLRAAWEDAYPALADDLGAVDPAARHQQDRLHSGG